MELLSVGLLSQVGTVRTALEIVQLLGNLPAPLVVVYPRRMARVLPRKRFVWWWCFLGSVWRHVRTRRLGGARTRAAPASDWGSQADCRSERSKPRSPALTSPALRACEPPRVSRRLWGPLGGGCVAVAGVVAVLWSRRVVSRGSEPQAALVVEA